MSSVKIEPQQNVELKSFTSIKIGGRARYFFEADSAEALRKIIGDFGSSFYILGKGSNLLIKDGLIKKPVVKLGKEFDYIREKQGCLEVGALTSLSFLIKYCVKKDLSGVENLAGIPASVGGLLRMNASSFGKSISSCVESVDVLDKQGRALALKKNDIACGYRESCLGDYFILGARLRLSKAAGIKEKIHNLLARRFELQDYSFPSCGCIFKNPLPAAGSKPLGAGYLIESCGLKGLSKGGAQVSEKHANFIINKKNAKYKDVDCLIKKIKERVYKKYKIILEEEIKRWQEQGQNEYQRS